MSAALIAIGLLGLSVSTSFAAYLLSWIAMGLGMSCGLYDAAFATLGHLYRDEARVPITTLTLWGGFASTVSWPFSALLVDQIGWQGACVVYAVLHLLLALPLYLFVLPQEKPDDRPIVINGTAEPQTAAREAAMPAKRRAVLLAMAATAFTISAIIASVIAAHLIIILQARDFTLAAAVALGALIGPSQVGARVIELLIGRRFHPVWTLVTATILIASGLIVQLWGLSIVAAGLILYGAGMGIMSIVRGTLPLALFGATGFATLVGYLAMPSLIAQSLSPLVAAFLLDRFDVTVTLSVLTVLGAANIALAVALSWRSRSSHT
jgi:hypothetical protein